MSNVPYFVFLDREIRKQELEFFIKSFYSGNSPLIEFSILLHEHLKTTDPDVWVDIGFFCYRN